MPQSRVDEGQDHRRTVHDPLRGEPDPPHVKAVDAYWTSAAEHGMNASTFTARVIASTGADVAAALSGAVGAMSGPLHGGAPARVLHMLDETRTPRRRAQVRHAGPRPGRAPDGLRPPRLPRRRPPRPGPAPYRQGTERPPLRSRRALEKAALEELQARKPDRVLATNVEYWAAVVLDFAQIPASMFTSMFTCARTAGWSAHILEQKRTGRLVRPSARYVGPAVRDIKSVEGADEALAQGI